MKLFYTCQYMRETRGWCTREKDTDSNTPAQLCSSGIGLAVSALLSGTGGLELDWTGRKKKKKSQEAMIFTSWPNICWFLYDWRMQTLN